MVDHENGARGLRTCPCVGDRHHTMSVRRSICRVVCVTSRITSINQSFSLSFFLYQTRDGRRSHSCQLQGQEESVCGRVERPTRNHGTILHGTTRTSLGHCFLCTSLALWVLCSDQRRIPIQGRSTIQGLCLTGTAL